jgi:hypothetical protein
VIAEVAPSGLFRDGGWLQSSTFALLDHRVAVHSDSPAAIALVEELFAATRHDGPAARALVLGRADGPDGAGYFAAADGEILVRSRAPGVAFRHLVFAANQSAIEATRGRVRLHAAAAVRGGAAVVMPGGMGSGKSTLVAALMRRGWSYLTDEAAAISSQGRVAPYAKPISLGTPPPELTGWTWSPAPGAAQYLGSSGLLPPSALGAVAPAGAPMVAVVLPQYRPGAPVRVEHLDAADALEAVGAHTFHLDAPGALSRLASVLDGVPCVRVQSGDLQGTCDVVDHVIDGLGR